MAFADSDHAPPDPAAQAVKLLVAGGFGVGKTTMVGAVSEIRPLRTEERLADSFSALDFFKSREIPFIVAVNCFDDADVYEEDEVRRALDIRAHVPVQFCDARNRASGKEVLVRLLEHLVASASGTTSPSRLMT